MWISARSHLHTVSWNRTGTRMTSLPDLCVRRELAEELKNLGVRQESLFYWIDKYPDAPSTMKEDARWQPVLWSMAGDIRYAAFTSGELGEMLPFGYVSGRTSDGKFGCYNDPEVEMTGEFQIEKTEADARAKMLIYLLKEGLVKVDHLNKSAGGGE